MAKKKRKKKRGPKQESLRGTYLSIDSRGIYIWRRTDPLTGRRVPRSTGTRDKKIALREAAKFNTAHERRAAGLVDYSDWRRKLRPLVDEWVPEDVENGSLRTKRARIIRALGALKLVTAANLTDVAKLDNRLKALGKAESLSNTRLRRSYQNPLRQFSKWLSQNNQYLDRDPLLTWKLIEMDAPATERRAFLPREVSLAFLSLTPLARIHQRETELVPTFTSLLVTAPRSRVLRSRNVEDYLPRAHRIDQGPGRGKKRTGAGAIDTETNRELAAYVGRRLDGPLFLSPEGVRWDKKRLLKVWQEAFSFGLVVDLWPKEEDQRLDLVHMVNQALIHGRPKVSTGGNPKYLKPETKKRRRDLEQRVLGVADALRSEWSRRMEGLDIHAFRKTHRTWATAMGVAPVLIDKQMGHTDHSEGISMDILRVIAGSRTGRKHYTDMRSSMLDAGRSAAAVRQLFDQAMEDVRQEANPGSVAYRLAYMGSDKEEGPSNPLHKRSG